jgi:hypothetical protein
MTTLVGSAPNQIPTNGDLGSAAYLDAATLTKQTTPTGASLLPVGTSAQQPAGPTAGMLRFNSETGQFEGYNGTAWGAIGGGGDGFNDFLLMGS